MATPASHSRDKLLAIREALGEKARDWPLIAAAAGTDYADLTGETMFIRNSIDAYHKQAVDTGARIVHVCGFDSIPSHLTVYALHKRAAEDGAGELGDTRLVVRSFAGGVSGGTVASMFEVMRTASTDPEARRLMPIPTR